MQRQGMIPQQQPGQRQHRKHLPVGQRRILACIHPERHGTILVFHAGVPNGRADFRCRSKTDLHRNIPGAVRHPEGLQPFRFLERHRAFQPEYRQRQLIAITSDNQ